MPSTSKFDDVAGRATSPRNVSIFTAILVGLPAALVFRELAGYGPGSFLLLLAVAVGVPTALDQHGELGNHWGAVGKTLVGSVGVTAVLSGLYAAGRVGLSLPRFQVAVVAFLIAELGAVAVLELRG